MKNLFKNKKLTLYFLSHTISSFGVWIRFVIAPLYIYSLTGSYVTMGVSFIISTLPQIFIAPFFAFKMDSINKKVLLIGINLIRGILVLGYISFQNIYSIYIITFLFSLVSSYEVGAKMVVLRQIVPKKDLLVANSLINTVDNGILLVGPIVGGLIADQFGFGLAFIIDSLSYIIFALSLLLIEVPNKQTTSQEVVKDHKQTNIFSQFKEVIVYLKNKETLMVYIFTTIPLWIGVNGILIIYPALCNELTNVSTSYGILWSVVGAGQMIGGLLLGILKFNKKSSLMIYYFGLLLTGIFHLFFTISSSFILALVLVFIATLGDGISFVAEDYFIQKKVKKDYMVQYFSVINIVIAASGAIGSLMTTVLLKFVAYQKIGVISSSIIAFAGLWGILRIISIKIRSQQRNHEYANN